MVCVFGGYTVSGGKFEVILHALPYELTIIFGGAIGALIIGNAGKVIIRNTGRTEKSFRPAKMERRRFPGCPLPSVHHYEAGQVQRYFGYRKSHREPAGKRYLPEVSENRRRSFRDSVHLRHPTHAVDEFGRSASGF